MPIGGLTSAVPYLLIPTFVVVHHPNAFPSPQEKDQAMKDFAEPKLKFKMSSITLVRGDTLIMPSDTIHAPISMTDCSVGGMCILHVERSKATTGIRATTRVESNSSDRERHELP